MNRNEVEVIVQRATEYGYKAAIENGELTVYNLMFSDNQKKAKEAIMQMGSFEMCKAILDMVKGVFDGKDYAAYVGSNVIVVNPLAKAKDRLSDNECSRQLAVAFQGYLIAKEVSPELKTWKFDQDLQGVEHGREAVIAQLNLVAELEKAGQVPTTAAGNALHVLVGQYGFKREIASHVIHAVMSKWGFKEVAERFIQLEA